MFTGKEVDMPSKKRGGLSEKILKAGLLHQKAYPPENTRKHTNDLFWRICCRKESYI